MARQVELGQMLLRAMRQIDALEGRLAAAMGFRSAAAADVTAQLQQRLAALETELSPSSASTPPYSHVFLSAMSVLPPSVGVTECSSALSALRHNFHVPQVCH